jgi:FkbM family methyltransferase
MILDNSPEDIRDLAEIWPLCFEFRLPPNSTIIIAGAYQGKVVQLLADLYPNYERIIGFEPQQWAVERARERLVHSKYPRTPIFPHAIGIENGTFPMGEWNTDACSFINTGVRDTGEGKMLEFDGEMYGLGVRRIDLAVLNMEGYEFKLMPYLREIGWAERIDRIACQWHVNLGAGGYEEIDEEINAWQELGHKVIYDHRPQWTYTENWKRWEALKNAVH